MFYEETNNGATDAVRISVTNIMVSSAQLVRVVKQLSRHLDAVDQVVETLEHTGTRARLMHLSKTSRECLMHGVVELCQQLRKMPELQRQFVKQLTIEIIEPTDGCRSSA